MFKKITTILIIIGLFFLCYFMFDLSQKVVINYAFESESKKSNERISKIIEDHREEIIIFDYWIKQAKLDYISIDELYEKYQKIGDSIGLIRYLGD